MASKRLSAELVGNEAIKTEIIYTTLSLNDFTKKEADAIFLSISVLAVEKMIENCKNATGVQYPSHAQIIEYLSSKE